MVSTRLTTSRLGIGGTEVPQTEDRQDDRPPVIGRPPADHDEPVRGTADIRTEGTQRGYGFSMPPDSPVSAHSSSHSRAVTVRSMDSQRIIDNLQDDLAERNRENERLRKFLADQGLQMPDGDARRGGPRQGEHRVDVGQGGHATTNRGYVRDEDRTEYAGRGVRMAGNVDPNAYATGIMDQGYVNHRAWDDMTGTRHYDRGYGWGDYRVDREYPRAPMWSTYKDFRDCKPPSFDGGKEPLDCRRWLRKMEQVFESGRFEEHQKVVFASRMLEGAAADWWDMVSQSMTPVRRATIYWIDFMGRIQDRFCATSAVQRAGREFLDLRMGSMSVEKFNSLFLEKLQFARQFCPDERSLVARYVEALDPDYRVSVRGKLTLEAAMEEARVIEGDRKDKGLLVSTGSEKRKFDGSSGSSKKKSSHWESSKIGDREYGKYCNTCRNQHRGPCSSKTMRCRKCGKVGHEMAECKNPPLCYKCRESGHISTDCPNEEKSDQVCYTCKEVGHISRDCPRNKGGKKT